MMITLNIWEASFRVAIAVDVILDAHSLSSRSAIVLYSFKDTPD